jgi:hypothetical protein
MRIHKPGRITSGAQTVAVPSRNTGTSIPARRGGTPTVPLKMTTPSGVHLVQRQTFTHPLKKQGFK